MNKYLKNGVYIVIGMILGILGTYMVMERLMNWFDLEFASARMGILVSSLNDFESKGENKGIKDIQDMLKAEMVTVKAKCDYFKCMDNPEEYALEIRSIKMATKYIERINTDNKAISK